MNIQLASFNHALSANEKRNSLVDTFNQSKANVLFAGHTLDVISDIDKIADELDNHNTVAFFEVKDFRARGLSNWQFRIQNNKILNCHSHQIFTDSTEINKNKYCAEQLVHELSSNRKFIVDDKKIILLVCGEINILKNIQSEENRVVVRAYEQELERDFETVLEQTDIILNPQHTPMGNQGKMAKRREHLSNKGKSYFSTSNMDQGVGFEKRKLQYAYVNGEEIIGDLVMSTSEYLVKEYQI